MDIRFIGQYSQTKNESDNQIPHGNCHFRKVSV